jgi:hypothetical protein
MSAICLCRETGQDDLATLSLPDRSYEWFLNLEIPWEAIQSQRTPNLFDRISKVSRV